MYSCAQAVVSSAGTNGVYKTHLPKATSSAKQESLDESPEERLRVSFPCAEATAISKGYGHLPSVVAGLVHLAIMAMLKLAGQASDILKSSGSKNRLT